LKVKREIIAIKGIKLSARTKVLRQAERIGVLMEAKEAVTYRMPIELAV